jgi:hypothetical protein
MGSTVVKDRGAEIAVRVIVRGPLEGVAMQIQRGREGLLPPTQKSAASLTFDFTLRVDPAGTGRPNFLGEFAQGPKEARFIYVNSGLRAGQTGTLWDRRAKLSLMEITSAQVRELLSGPGSLLEASIDGVGRDGGPACASVPLQGGGWRVRKARDHDGEVRGRL